jgi:hypothetical protein
MIFLIRLTDDSVFSKAIYRLDSIPSLASR